MEWPKKVLIVPSHLTWWQCPSFANHHIVWELLQKGGKLWFWPTPEAPGENTVYSACEEPMYLGVELNSCALGWMFGSIPSLVSRLDQSELTMRQLRMVLHWYNVKLILGQVDNGAKHLSFFLPPHPRQGLWTRRTGRTVSLLGKPSSTNSYSVPNNYFNLSGKSNWPAPV